MTYNMFFSDVKTDGKSAEELKKQEQRLADLRKKQGRDVEYYKDQLMEELNLDREKAKNLGQIDL